MQSINCLTHIQYNTALQYTLDYIKNSLSSYTVKYYAQLPGIHNITKY